MLDNLRCHVHFQFSATESDYLNQVVDTNSNTELQNSAGPDQIDMVHAAGIVLSFDLIISIG